MTGFNFNKYLLNNPLLKEADGASIEELIPGVQFEKSDVEFDTDDYDSVESYVTNVPGISGDYGDDDLYLNIYDGDKFSFFHAGAPVPTPLHSDSDKDSMYQTQMEVPLPLDQLDRSIFDGVVASIKEKFNEEI